MYHLPSVTLVMDQTGSTLPGVTPSKDLKHGITVGRSITTTGLPFPPFTSLPAHPTEITVTLPDVTVAFSRFC